MVFKNISSLNVGSLYYEATGVKHKSMGLCEKSEYSADFINMWNLDNYLVLLCFHLLKENKGHIRTLGGVNK